MRNKSNKRLPIIFRIFIFGYIVVLAVLFVVEPAKMAALHKRCTFETTGTVVDSEVYRYDDDGSVTYKYKPIFEFEMNGVTYVYEGGREMMRSPEVGDVYTLIVNPDNPEEFYNPQQDSNALRSSIVSGVFALIFGVIIYSAAKKLVDRFRRKFRGFMPPNGSDPYYYS